MDDQAIVAEIKKASDAWDLPALETLSRTHQNAASEDVLDALLSALSYHYGQMYMDYATDKLKGEPIAIVQDLLVLLKRLQHLDPQDHYERDHAMWLRHLAELHNDIPAKKNYYEQALTVINTALASYNNKQNLLLEKHNVLSDMLNVSELVNPQIQNAYRQVWDAIFAGVNGKNISSLTQQIHALKFDDELHLADYLPELLDRYEVALKTLANDDPEVVLIDAKSFARNVYYLERYDQDLYTDLVQRVDASLALKSFDIQNMDELSTYVFLSAKNIDIKTHPDQRKACLQQVLVIAERLIAAYPKRPQGYEEKAKYYLQLGKDGIAMGNTKEAAKNLNAGLAFAEAVAPEVLDPYLLYAKRIEMHEVFNKHILGYKNKDYNLGLVALMQQNNLARFESYKNVFKNKKDQYGAYANHDFKKIAWLQLISGDTDAAWASLMEWQEIIEVQQELWGYLIYNLAELLEDIDFAPLHNRLKEWQSQQKSISANDTK
jgi:hypothetical protein